MDEIPADASTLIYLAKAGCVDLAARCTGGLLATPGVWREAVDEGERRGAPEVPILRQSGAIRRVPLDAGHAQRAKQIAVAYRLGVGESEVLSIGADVRFVLVDDARAARVARSIGLSVASTLAVPLIGFRAGMLDAGAATELLDRLAEVTHARADTYLRVQREIRRR
jgi:predicted nucleic acid-binding protein